MTSTGAGRAILRNFNQDEEMRQLGARLVATRKYLGMTPETFATMLDMTKRAYLAWERGQRRGQGAAFIRLVRPLYRRAEVSTDWLFCGETAGVRSETPLRSDGSPIKRTADCAEIAAQSREGLSHDRQGKGRVA